MTYILINDLNYIYKNNRINFFFKNKIFLITEAVCFVVSFFSNFLCYFHEQLKIKKKILNEININKLKNILLKFIKNKCFYN